LEVPDVVVVAEQRGGTLSLGGVKLSTDSELALDHAECVDRDARVELHPCVGAHRHDVLLEELAHGLDELGRGRSILAHSITTLRRGSRAGPIRSPRPYGPASRARSSARGR